LELAIGGAEAGQRIDRVLAGAFRDLSRSRIQALIAAGHVTADGATIGDANFRVKPGHLLRIEVPEPEPARPRPEAIALAVVYEDAQVIVVDKPAGLVVHPAPGNPDRTLVNALLHHCGASLSGVGGVRRPGIVHRLDKDTSGLLVAAKNDAAHSGLAVQFAVHSVERAYWAIVAGVPRPAAGEIVGAIGRNPRNRKTMAVVRRGGKAAITRYRTLERFGSLAALIECRLATGRTHQIRVHLASIGHPVLGDPAYGRRQRAQPEDVRIAISKLPGQALHARILGFAHPMSRAPLRFESEVPSYFSELIEVLRTAVK
jgi:23S rRNA pseudouridine1911/1915/1917 synthase